MSRADEAARIFAEIPEIVGRLPVLAYLNPLDKEARAKAEEALRSSEPGTTKEIKKKEPTEDITTSGDRPSLEDGEKGDDGKDDAE